ncbi:hypothetical protein D3C84_1214370 [compost metagenome]
MGCSGAGWFVGDAQPTQIGAAQIGKLFLWLDGAELVLTDLVVINQIPGRAQDGEQLELAINHVCLEFLHVAEV